MRDELLAIHGAGDCHICGKPKAGAGSIYCSYPHGMVPDKAVDADHPEGFWSAAPPADLAERIELYLEDAPSNGGHSDAAGANCWELLDEAMEALRRHAQPSPERAEGFTGTRWRHLKRGTSYEVVGVAKLQTALTEGLADETPMVVYRNEATNKLSVRSLDEFCDGRFEKLGRAAYAQRQPDPAGYWRDMYTDLLKRVDDGAFVNSAISPVYAAELGKLNDELEEENQDLRNQVAGLSAQCALPDQLELAQFLCSEVAAEPWDELSQPKYLADADIILAFLSSVTSTVHTPTENKEGGAS